MSHDPLSSLDNVPILIAIIFFFGISLIATAIEVHSNAALVLGILIIAWGFHQSMKWLRVRNRKSFHT